MFIRKLAAFIGLIAAMLVVSTVSADAADAAKPCTGTPTKYNKVILWVLENHSIDQTRWHMQYLDNLANQCSYFTKERAITHPSLPNYIALTAGSQMGVITNRQPTKQGIPGVNLFSQVGRWKTWAQSMPSNCAMRDRFPYEAHHNPALYYRDIRPECPQRDVPISQLAGNLQNRAPAFGVVIPDNCNNGHKNTCTPAGDTNVGSAHQADDYLREHLPDVLNSQGYKNGHMLVVITWDEGGGGGQHVYTVMIGPSFQGQVYQARYNHYSLLNLFERVTNVPCLRQACTAVRISLP